MENKGHAAELRFAQFVHRIYKQFTAFLKKKKRKETETWYVPGLAVKLISNDQQTALSCMAMSW